MKQKVIQNKDLVNLIEKGKENGHNELYIEDNSFKGMVPIRHKKFLLTQARKVGPKFIRKYKSEERVQKVLYEIMAHDDKYETAKYIISEYMWVKEDMDAIMDILDKKYMTNDFFFRDDTYKEYNEHFLYKSIKDTCFKYQSLKGRCGREFGTSLEDVKYALSIVPKKREIVYLSTEIIKIEDENGEII